MLRPKAYITITNKETGEEKEFNRVHHMDINKGFDQLTDTAEVTFPRIITQTGLNLFAGNNPLFKRGDKIKIEAGYLPNRDALFDGFIKNVGANIPVTLECEDYMFLMKQYTVTYPKTVQVQRFSKKGKPLRRPKISSEEITLKQLIDVLLHEGDYLDITNDLEYEVVDDIKLGQFRISNATPAQVFDKLRDLYGLRTYFVGKKLYCGFGYNVVSTKEADFNMERVVINSSTLDWQESRDVRVKVKVVSMLPDNTKIESQVGDEDGELRTLHFYNIKPESELKKIAEKNLSQLKYTGYRGVMETFGEPHLEHGDRVKLTSSKLPERNGSYLINSTRVIFGVKEGYKQHFELAEVS
jgi:hypothetical protein